MRVLKPYGWPSYPLPQQALPALLAGDAAQEVEAHLALVGIEGMGVVMRALYWA
jgi:hypothetical protein